MMFDLTFVDVKLNITSLTPDKK